MPLRQRPTISRAKSPSALVIPETFISSPIRIKPGIASKGNSSTCATAFSAIRCNGTSPPVTRMTVVAKSIANAMSSDNIRAPIKAMASQTNSVIFRFLLGSDQRAAH